MKVLFYCSIAFLSILNSAQAAFVLSWSPGSGTSIAGGPISVDLLLTETSTNFIDSFGLSNVGITVSRGLADVGTLATPIVSSAFSAPFFDSAVPGGADPSVTLSQQSLFGAGIGGGSTITLGSFTINPTIDGTGTLTVAGLLGNDDDIAVYSDGAGTILNLTDPLGINVFDTAPTFSYTFTGTVTAVPEPTSLVFGGVMGVSGLVSVYRRRKAKAAKK